MFWSISMRQTQRAKQLQSQLRQLILLRETGPKSAAWHAARARLIWRLHDELARAGQDAAIEEREPACENNSKIEDGG
jgi:hypothetical protein